MQLRRLQKSWSGRVGLWLAAAMAVAPAVTPAAFAQHVSNPFAGATQYLNPDYTKQVQALASQTADPTLAGQMNTVTTRPTAVWLDRIAAIAGSSATGGRMGLVEHLDAALTQQQGGAPIVVTIVIYDLPGRDCAALASNGELSILPNPPAQPLSGLDTYKTQYIDPIVAILSNTKYANVRIVAIVEPDSIPNLVTNAGGGVATIQACVDAKNTGVYVQGVQYAITQLHQFPNVYNYLDIGHSGWLGWPNNFSAAITQYTSLVNGTPDRLNTVDGFVTDTANTLPTREPFMNASQTIGGQPLISATFYEFNPYIDEASFAAGLYQAFVSAGFPSRIGFLIDTSRNGWGGSNRPSGPSPSVDLNTFVNDTKIDRRAHRGLWCNPAGAGIGAPPQANPPGFFSQLQAFVWIKPPGESDGTYLANLTPRPDPNCDPSRTNPLAGNTPTGALPNSPPAGQFFPAQFTQLIQNAFPPVPPNTNPDFSITATGVSVMQAATGASTVTVAPINGFAGNVALTVVSGLPAGVTASFAPASIAGGSGVSALTFTAAATAAVGPATVTVRGTSGALTHDASIALNVTGRPDFSVSAAPANVTLTPGTNPTSTITVASLYGFTGSVSLSASGLPAGVNANFSPSSVNGSGTIVVNFNAQTGTAGGTTNITITGAGGTLIHTATIALTVTGSQPDFSLSASPANLTIGPGLSGSSTITIARTNGFAANVALTVSGLPNVITGVFNPPSATTSSTVTFTVASTAGTAVYPVTVTGISGALSHSVAVTITVSGAPDFSLTAANASVAQGGTATSAIAIARVNGFAGAVALSAAGLPVGVTAAFNPASATGASSLLTFTATSAATIGQTTVTIAGTSGGLAHSTAITLTVTGNQPDFSLAVTPASLTIARGAGGSAAIAITRTGGFAGSVALTASGAPSGVTAALSPASAAGASSTLTLTASSAATTGAFTVKITGAGGGLTRTTSLALTVTPGNPGAVTVTPVINSNSPWYNEEAVRIASTTPITALSITITIQNTGGITYSGQYNTVGGQIAQSHAGTAAITYQFTQATGQTLTPGTYLFAAQASGTGTAHPTSGDAWSVTYTTGGATATQTGHF